MVYTRFYDTTALPFDRAQAMRYFGYRKGAVPTAEAENLFDSCLREVLSVSMAGETLDLGFTKTTSRSLARNLYGCDRVVAFAATIGVGVDRLIVRYGDLAADKAYACQAIGAERVEILCDAFCADLARRYGEQGLYVRPRFSCGYGDFPLEKQRDFFAALDCQRKIGLTLNDSLLMSPSKSVTAVVGIGRGECRPNGDKCEACEKTDCAYRDR